MWHTICTPDCRFLLTVAFHMLAYRPQELDMLWRQNRLTAQKL